MTALLCVASALTLLVSLLSLLAAALHASPKVREIDEYVGWLFSYSLRASLALAVGAMFANVIGG